MATDGAAGAVCVARIDGQFDGKSVIAAKATTYGCLTETKPRNMPILWITSFVDKFVALSLAYNEVHVIRRWDFGLRDWQLRTSGETQANAPAPRVTIATRRKPTDTIMFAHITCLAHTIRTQKRTNRQVSTTFVEM